MKVTTVSIHELSSLKKLYNNWQITLFKINTTSAFESDLAVLFLDPILGSKKAYATIEHIKVNIRLNVQAKNA